MDDDKYPNWKDALFGNHDAVANVRCAVHYVFWHTVYALIAVAGAIVVSSIKLGKVVAPYLGPLASPVGNALDRLFAGVSYVMNHRYTEKAFEVVLTVAVIAWLIAMAVALVFYLYTQFWATVTTIGVIVGKVALAIAILFLVEYLHDPARNAANGVAAKANAAGKRVVKTPGVRRVYGECPVSMSAAPKWFDKLFSEDDEL